MTCSVCGGRMVGDGRARRCATCGHELIVKPRRNRGDSEPIPGPEVERAKAKPTVVRHPKSPLLTPVPPAPLVLREPPMPQGRCPGCGNKGRCCPGNHPLCRENWTQR